MVEIAFYLVSEEIARRAGVINSRYRTQDGRYVLDDKDLSYIRLTPDEYISGLKGVERVTKKEAMTEIQKENYQIGVEQTMQQENEEQPTQEEEVVETPNDASDSNENTEEEKEQESEEIGTTNEQEKEEE